MRSCLATVLFYFLPTILNHTTATPHYSTGFHNRTFPIDTIKESSTLPFKSAESMGINGSYLADKIDSIALSGIEGKAYPGCVVLVAKEGNIIFNKAYGTYNYGQNDPMDVHTLFDMASVTKVCATTISIMKLYEEGKLDLTQSLGTYLPWVRGSDKADLKIEDILLHQARLIPDVVFYLKTVDQSSKTPLPAFFQRDSSKEYGVRVAKDLFLKSDYWKTMNQSIVDSKLLQPGKYVYSDNDFIFLGDIVEAISGLRVDKYAAQNFYEPMGLLSIGFNPVDRFDTNRIAPTESDNYFRHQHLRGFVHDEGAAMFGGVAGHAGLFSDAQDIAALLQMLLDGGMYKGKQYLNPETIKLFTAYNSNISARGLGFDKPQKDNFYTSEPFPYPSRFASPLTFGHTGYTGTFVWADPEYDVVFVFLSNRVNPVRSTNLYKLHIRGSMMDAIYEAITPEIPEISRWKNLQQIKQE